MIKSIVVAFLAFGLVGTVVAETEQTTKPAEEKTTAKKKGESAKGETTQTPFGPAKGTPSEPLPESELSSDPFVSAEEKGDLVIFRRKTPFGAQVWKKKKSELTADERAILARGPRPEEKPRAAKPKTDAKSKASKKKTSDQQ